ncbi:CLUMA_CG012419, isoform A [Clunio marinus]|uniref:CLUMA_CG012419, isoform A n=1 Tax=Clunio marinus TaxID=568069 RepID=A0A1J1IKZ8_9DIPT|nr:CLUMA_CG012419, isoform A [Clunio marinus]
MDLLRSFGSCRSMSLNNSNAIFGITSLRVLLKCKASLSLERSSLNSQDLVKSLKFLVLSTISMTEAKRGLSSISHET